MTKLYQSTIAIIMLGVIVGALLLVGMLFGHAAPITVFGTPGPLSTAPPVVTGSVGILATQTNETNIAGVSFDETYLLCSGYPNAPIAVESESFTQFGQPVWSAVGQFWTNTPTIQVVVHTPNALQPKIFRLRQIVIVRPLDVCIDPTDTNCICTNCSSTNDYVSGVYQSRAFFDTNGVLNVGFSNTLSGLYYTLETSTDLTSSAWSKVGLFVGTGTNEFVTNVDSSGAMAFYRAHRGFAIVSTNQSAGSCGHPITGCSNTYCGYAPFFNSGHTFIGWEINTNTTYHTIQDLESPANSVQWTGQHFDVGCGDGGFSQLSTNPVSSFYRLVSYWTTTNFVDGGLKTNWADGFNP